MINFSLLISLSEVEGPGGLFDINATLPLVAIQFILLMVVLNVILYNPLLTAMEERKEYILTTLAEASRLLEEGIIILNIHRRNRERKRLYKDGFDGWFGAVLNEKAYWAEREFQERMNDTIDKGLNDVWLKKQFAFASLNSITEEYVDELYESLYVRK
jgi:F-type H+-transporting ATPase subunit b